MRVGSWDGDDRLGVRYVLLESTLVLMLERVMAMGMKKGRQDEVEVEVEAGTDVVASEEVA